MNAREFFVGVLTAATLTVAAQAQTAFNEIEPNGQKSEATLATGMVAGDTLNGAATGTSTTLGNTLLASADTWRIKTAALPFGIYRHTLAITTAGTAGHVGTIRGLSQSAGVIGTGDATLQTGSTTIAVPRPNSWYGFGREEEIYWRITGVTATTSPYVATLSTVPVTPVAIPGTFSPGMITITTYQQGHTSDTEIYVYDANLDPVPLGHNDGSPTSGILTSILDVNLPAGSYYVIVSRFNLANNQSDANPGETAQSSALLDFPNVISTSNTTLNANVTFTITDGTNSTQQPATLVNAHELFWGTFTVGNTSTPATSYCFGDGTGTACPCANAGLAGNGCASSVNANGANLAGSGLASIAADSFVLTGSGMPNSSALYFQGTSRVAAGAGAQFGDGLRCAGGTVARLGTKTNSGGTSMYPSAGDVSISIRGSNVAGGTRDYQCWYRNAAAFCTAATFNLTNGVEVTWVP